LTIANDELCLWLFRITNHRLLMWDRAAGAYVPSSQLKSADPEQIDQAVQAIKRPMNNTGGSSFESVHRRLGTLLTEKVGLVLNAERLQFALDRLLEMRENEN